MNSPQNTEKNYWEDGIGNTPWISEDPQYICGEDEDKKIKDKREECERFIHQTNVQKLRDRVFEHLAQMTSEMRDKGVKLVDVTSDLYSFPIDASFFAYVDKPECIHTGFEKIDILLRSTVAYISDHRSKAKSSVNYSNMYIHVGRYGICYHHRANKLRSIQIDVDWDAPNSDLLEMV